MNKPHLFEKVLEQNERRNHYQIHRLGQKMIQSLPGAFYKMEPLIRKYALVEYHSSR